MHSLHKQLTPIIIIIIPKAQEAAMAKFIIGAIAGIISLIFIVQNTETVDITFIAWTITLPRAVFLINKRLLNNRRAMRLTQSVSPIAPSFLQLGHSVGDEATPITPQATLAPALPPG